MQKRGLNLQHKKDLLAPFSKLQNLKLRNPCFRNRSPVFGIPDFGIPGFGISVLGRVPVRVFPTFGIPAFRIPVFGIPSFGTPAFGIPTFGILVEFSRPLVRHPLDPPKFYQQKPWDVWAQIEGACCRQTVSHETCAMRNH